MLSGDPLDHAFGFYSVLRVGARLRGHAPGQYMDDIPIGIFLAGIPFNDQTTAQRQLIADSSGLR